MTHIHEEGHVHEEHHEHHHEHTYTYQKTAEQLNISVYCHESAVIGAVNGSFDEYYRESIKKLAEIMKETATLVTAQGGIIGHVKSFVRSSEDYCMLSITDDELVVNDKKERHTKFDCAAIVFGITEKQLYVILDSTFGK